MNTQPKKETVAVLVSGGLDSLVLLDSLAPAFAAVFPVYIRGGLVWERAELYWLRRFLAGWRAPTVHALTVLRLPLADLYAGHWSVTGVGIPGYFAEDPECYLPGRNILLLAKVAIHCARHAIDTIAMAQLRGNPFPDSTPRFFRRMQDALSLGLNYQLKVLTPFLKCSKAEIIRQGGHLPLHLTFSCMKPHGRSHCGTCTKCAERQKAFRAAGLPDPTRYAAAPRPPRLVKGGSHAY